MTRTYPGEVERGVLAIRLLRSAIEACAARDAARAHVVLGFEGDVRGIGPACDGASLRVHGLVERIVDLALRVADLARLAARRGAPPVDELDRLCSRSLIVAAAAREMLTGVGGPVRAEMGAVMDVLLRGAEASAAAAERELERGRSLCLVS